MGEVAGQGRTVIFVSHQMGAVTKLCSSAILMRQGSVDKVGRVDEVIAHYLNSINRTSDGIQLHSEDVDKDVFVESVDTMDETEAPCANFTHRNPIFVKLNLCLKIWRENMRVGLRVVDKLGRNIFTTEYKLTNQLQTGFIVKIPAGLLTPNSYYFSIGVYVPNVLLYDLHENIPAFNIIETGSDFEQYEGADYGCVFVDCEWEVSLSNMAKI